MDDAMTPRGEAREEAFDVDLGAARLRVFHVPLVEQQDPDRRRHEVAAAMGQIRPIALAIRSHQTIQSASNPIRQSSFDSPRVRSRKKKGISRMRAPAFTKR